MKSLYHFEKKEEAAAAVCLFSRIYLTIAFLQNGEMAFFTSDTIFSENPRSF